MEHVGARRLLTLIQRALFYERLLNRSLEKHKLQLIELLQRLCHLPKERLRQRLRANAFRELGQVERGYSDELVDVHQVDALEAVRVKLLHLLHHFAQ